MKQGKDTKCSEVLCESCHKIGDEDNNNNNNNNNKNNNDIPNTNNTNNVLCIVP